MKGREASLGAPGLYMFVYPATLLIGIIILWVLMVFLSNTSERHGTHMDTARNKHGSQTIPKGYMLHMHT